MGNKILKNLKLGLAGIVLAGGIYGCDNHDLVLREYSPLTKEQKDSLFKDLNPGLREFLDKVYLVKEEDMPKNHEGHVHPENLIMCLTKDCFSFKSKVHEAAHVRHRSLNKVESDFSKKWKQIANFEYGEENIKYNYFDDGSVWNIRWKDKTLGPKNGCLNSYSAIDMYEDVATFVESLDYVDEKLYLGYFPLFFADTTDHRYKQKLDLLKEYNFLTKDEHEKLSENLGSLNYLLKEEKNEK